MSSLHRIAENTSSRLVLTGRKPGLWLLTLFLLLNGSVLLYVGLFVASRRQLFVVIASSALGLFFAVCGVAAGVWAARYRSRIVIDRDQAVVRIETGRAGDATAIPLAEIASVETRTSRGGPGRRSRREHRVFLLDAHSREWLIDRSTDEAKMAALATRLRELTRSRRTPGAEASLAPPAEEGIAAATPGTPPVGIAIEPGGGGTVYRWRTLPRGAFWGFFWGFVTLFLGSLTGLALAGVVAAITRQPPLLTVVFLALAALTLGLAYGASRRGRRRGAVPLGVAALIVILASLLIGSQPFLLFGIAAAVLGVVTSLSAFVLLGRCRLRVSASGIDYQEHILGVPLRWRRRSVPAAEILDFRIKAAVRGGGALEVHGPGGRALTLMIPQGKGTFSRRDLTWLRQRWLSELAG